MGGTVHILITEPFDRELVSRLSAMSDRLAVHVHPARKAEEIPAILLTQTEVLYTLRALPEPSAAPALRWVQLHLAGMDRLTDHPLLKAGVEFTSLSGAAVSQMAEYAVMMMLALGHHLPEMEALQERREWPHDRWERLSPVEIRGSVVGIVGYGRVGREIGRICRLLGARVLAVKRDAMHPEDSGYTLPGTGDPAGELAERIYPPQALRRMLGECDYVVVCLPFTSQSKALIDAGAFGAMKRGAYLVNLARGGVVDEGALLGTLRDGRLRGAAIDVFATEPLDPESPLWSAPRLLLSPHIAGDSPHYDSRAIDLFAANLRRYLAGEPLLNRFDPERGY